MRNVSAAAAAALALLLLLPGCPDEKKKLIPYALIPDATVPPDAEPAPPPTPTPPFAPVAGATVDSGAALYRTRCAGCHGEDGRGQTPEAKQLRLAPTSLKSSGYLCRTTDGRPVSIPSDADVESAIDRGTHRGRPEVAGLDAAARYSLLLYLKSLSTDFNGDPQPLAAIAPEPPDGAESRARGRTLFLAFGCWRCHGTGGAGDGPALASIRWNDQPLARLTPLSAHDEFLCGSQPEQVYRVISLGMVGSATTLMPRYQEFSENYPRPLKGTPEEWTRALEGKVPAADVDALRKFLAELPDQPTVQAMKPSERRARAGQFLWDLVHYVRSL
jgi:mono/diheme cytochrome c family protein